MSLLHGNEHLQEMVSDLVVVGDLLDVGANDGPLLLEDSDGTNDVDIDVFSLVEVLESSWHLVLTLLVEDDLVDAGVIADFKHDSHVLLLNVDDSAHDLDVLNLVAVNFELLVWADGGVFEHLEGHWNEDSWLSLLLLTVVTVLVLGLASANTSKLLGLVV